MAACLSSESLKHLLADALPEGEAQGLREHLAGCAPCQALLERLFDSPNWRRWASEGWPEEANAPREPHLVRVLEKLRASGAGNVTASGDTAQTGPTALSFLRPPEREGDLGMLGPYHVLAELGRGGMGIVLRAYDPELGRTVALKVLPPQCADAGARARFVREAQAAAAINHDHVVPVYTVANPRDGPPYFVMQYVEGPTLRQRMKAAGRLDPTEAAHLAEQVAEGLAAAHHAGLVHCDVKPANVILDSATSRAKITDFGLVRVMALPGGTTQDGAVRGTPEYMSPEQARTPDRIDARSDVYSLGVTLYEALTGNAPFHGVAHVVLQQILNDEPRPPRRLNDSIPRDLETICLKCLEKEPGKRYASAAEMAEDLRRFLAGKPIQARPIRVWERGVKWARRRPAVVALLTSIALAMALGLAGVVWQWREAEAARRQVADKAETLETNLYYMRIALAERELKRRIGSRADELLDQCPRHLRGWEWHYLKRFPFASFPTRHHETLVIRVAFSPDGRYLASGDLDGNVRVWKARTGDEVRTFRAHQRRVWALAFSPDGRYLATGGREDHLVRVWDVAAGQLLHELASHTDGINGLVFSPNGKHLGSASLDRTVRLWDLNSGQEILTFREQHAQPLAINGLAFCADGQRLTSVSVDGVVKVWDAATGETVSTFHGEIGWVASAAFSLDGLWLALGGENGNVKVYQTVAAGLSERLQAVRTLEAHDSEVRYLALSPGGRRLASTGEDRTLKVWDVTTGHEALLLDIHSRKITSLAFSPDGNRLASGSADHTVKVSDGTPWVDFENGEHGVLTSRFAWTAHDHKVVEVAFSPGSQRLISASWDKTVKIWNLSAGERGASAPQLMLTVPGLPADLTGVAISHDGQYLAASSLDGTVTICNAHSGEIICTLPRKDGPVYGVAFNPISNALASAHYDGTVKVWDVERRGGEADRPIFTISAHSDAVFAVAYSADGQFLASAGGRDQEKNLGVWEAATGKPIHCLRQEGGFVRSVAFSPDGKRLAATSAFQVVLWDVATGEKLRTITLIDRAFRVAFSPDGKRLATACEGQTVWLWDAATGKELAKLRVSGGEPRSVAFNPDGFYLASCSGYKDNGTIQIWDAGLWDK
jgi:WD40 repeat protein/serine/threonine protein kinase